MKDVSYQFKVFAASQLKANQKADGSCRESRFKICLGTIYKNIGGNQLFIFSK